ncbi:MAG TPA: ECF-type sigma factor [Planctomycetota bacterium]|nr:ECF-type sigma factor [Planctomycetota bacterium]
MQWETNDGGGPDPTPDEVPQDASALFDLLYGRLKQQARQAMRGQHAGHTLQPTALVNEVYLRMYGAEQATWSDRKHFLFTAARAMRQILTDSARRRNAVKRGGGMARDPLGDIAVEYEDRSLDMESLHAALEKLATFDPAMARAVELRFFAGCGMDEVAQLLDMAPRTLHRKWAATRAWLYGEIV